MKRIIIHWTAGTGSPNSVDKQHYHYLIDSKGEIHNGDFKPEDNENCSDGKYAAHTGGGNTGSIGISLCGMYGFTSADNVGNYPLSKIQCEAAFKLAANLAKKYNIPVTKQTVMTHYEFGLKNPSTTSAGKIDIIYLPPYPDVEKAKAGDFIRNKIRWYLANS
ncbi:MAG: N-acetylmuramoyl-L-alanine amidase [Candidatus Gastranaerophilales bacterium]|nr:N-acetylmuramoyl-L-alanine amidase [Candidatus Gastranaerophilales bacterium]